MSYLRNCGIENVGWGVPSVDLSFLKNAIKSEPFRIRGYHFQDFYVSMIPTSDKNFKKNSKENPI